MLYNGNNNNNNLLLLKLLLLLFVLLTKMPQEGQISEKFSHYKDYKKYKQDVVQPGLDEQRGLSVVY